MKIFHTVSNLIIETKFMLMHIHVNVTLYGTVNKFNPCVAIIKQITLK